MICNMIKKIRMLILVLIGNINVFGQNEPKSVVPEFNDKFEITKVFEGYSKK
jgi:hypothetical protein